MNRANSFTIKKENLGVNEIIAYLNELESIIKVGTDSFKARIIKLTREVDRKIPYRDGHSIRVSQFSQEIAKRLSISKKEIFDIAISALLHDFGKIAIEESTLQKKQKLTKKDWIEIKMHPIRGYFIIQGFKFLNKTLPGIRWHHERLDGSGYPDGLKENEIPMMARIIAVADTFDAMTQKRPYGAKIRVEKAKKILKKDTPLRLDKNVVDAFLSIPFTRIRSILKEE
jgi:HD-GYP domain-containing protein (c-di-GMP phosphodiesterase class II)